MAKLSGVGNIHVIVECFRENAHMCYRKGLTNYRG